MRRRVNKTYKQANVTNIGQNNLIAKILNLTGCLLLNRKNQKKFLAF